MAYKRRKRMGARKRKVSGKKVETYRRKFKPSTRKRTVKRKK